MIIWLPIDFSLRSDTKPVDEGKDASSHLPKSLTASWLRATIPAGSTMAYYRPKSCAFRN